MQIRFAALCCACAALWLQPAIAQQQAPVNSANPADPRTETSAPRYQSVFEGYRPFQDEKLAPWRDVNDEVARTGGHIGIFGGGHAGHGGGKTVTNTLAPATAAPKPSSPMHGPGHQGMKK